MHDGESSKAAVARKSQYKKIQGSQRQQIDFQKNQCQGCGRTSHGANKSMERKDCPAIKQSCRSCGKLGHYQIVCKSKARSAVEANQASQLKGEIDGEVVGNETTIASASATFF